MARGPDAVDAAGGGCEYICDEASDASCRCLGCRGLRAEAVKATECPVSGLTSQTSSGHPLSQSGGRRVRRGRSSPSMHMTPSPSPKTVRTGGENFNRSVRPDQFDPEHHSAAQPSSNFIPDRGVNHPVPLRIARLQYRPTPGLPRKVLTSWFFLPKEISNLV